MTKDNNMYFKSGVRFVKITGNDKFKGVGKGKKALNIDDSGIHIKTSKTEGNITDTFKSRNIHIEFNEIENIDNRKFLKAKLIFHTDANTYTVTGLSAPKKSDTSDFNNFSELVNFLENKIAEVDSTDQKDTMKKLRELAEMRKDGLISEDEFEELKNDLIN
jgi:hypothetical protein